MTMHQSSRARIASARATIDDALAARPPAVTRWMTFADHTVEASADRALASLLEPFAHLETASTGNPRLAIRMAAAPADRRAWGIDGLGENGEFMVSEDGGVLVHARAFGMALLDRGGGTLHAALSEPRTLPTTERAKPLSALLSVWYADRGIDVIHAGLVSMENRGVLVGGVGGSGKSTVALACAAAGFEFLGDDAVGVRVGDDEIAGFSLYGSVCLEPDHLEGIANVCPSDAIEASDHDKSIVRMNRIDAVRVGHGTTVVAIVFPRVGSESRTTVSTVTPRDALFALAPSSIIGRAVPGSRTLKRIGALVSRVPAFRLDMSSNLDEIAPAMRSILERGIA